VRVGGAGSARVAIFSTKNWAHKNVPKFFFGVPGFLENILSLCFNQNQYGLSILSLGIELGCVFGCMCGGGYGCVRVSMKPA